jgi:hypothetical protein
MKEERTKKQWMNVVSCDWVLCVCGFCNAILQLYKKVPSYYYNMKVENPCFCALFIKEINYYIDIDNF